MHSKSSYISLCTRNSHHFNLKNFFAYFIINKFENFLQLSIIKKLFQHHSPKLASLINNLCNSKKAITLLLLKAVLNTILNRSSNVHITVYHNFINDIMNTFVFILYSNRLFLYCSIWQGFVNYKT